MKVGGFQSGFHARLVKRSECKWPEYLICQHNCPHIVQLISHVSGEVEFELCVIEADRMAKVLLEAVGYNTKFLDQLPYLFKNFMDKEEKEEDAQ